MAAVGLVDRYWSRREAFNRNGLALLIAVLVEAGSALGFTITILATSGPTGARQSEAVEPPATSRRKPIL